MKSIGKGRIVQLVEYEVETPSGKKLSFEKARRAPGVRLIVENDNKQILLNKEFRYELGSSDWRLPGGKVVDSLDDYLAIMERGDSIEDHVITAAQREGQEEVGIDVVDAEIIDKSVCGATMERDLWYVKITDFTLLSNLELEEGEVIDDHGWFGYAEIQAMLLSGDVKEGRSAAVLMKIVFG